MTDKELNVGYIVTVMEDFYRDLQGVRSRYYFSLSTLCVGVLALLTSFVMAFHVLMGWAMFLIPINSAICCISGIYVRYFKDEMDHRKKLLQNLKPITSQILERMEEDTVKKVYQARIERMEV